MEFKSLVQDICWLVVDGLAILWVLYMLGAVIREEYFVEALSILAKAMCG